MMSSMTNKLRCFVVGESTYGKNLLAGISGVRSSVVFDTKVVDIQVHGEQVQLILYDMNGTDVIGRQSFWPRFMQENADIVIACFDKNNPNTLESTVDSMLPERDVHYPDATVILVGDTKGFLPLAPGDRFLEKIEAARRRIGAIVYLDCSSTVKEEVRIVFETAVAARLAPQRKPPQSECTVL